MSDGRALTPPERQALLVGLNDARNRHKVRAPVALNRRPALLRLILGHAGFPPLANPHLEALRALAMRLGACRDRLDAKEDGHALDTPLLVSAARFVREQSKGEPPTTFSPPVGDGSDAPADLKDVRVLELDRRWGDAFCLTEIRPSGASHIPVRWLRNLGSSAERA